MFFSDVFADVYNFRKSVKINSSPESNEEGYSVLYPAFANLKNSFYCTKTSIEYYLHNIPEVLEPPELKMHSDKLRTTLKSSVSMLTDACNLVGLFPVASNDSLKLYEFLEILMSRLKALRKGYSMIVPCGWITNDSGEKGRDEAVVCLILVSRTNDSHEKDYSVSIINTSGDSGGLMYHPQSVDTESGATLFNLSATLSNVRNDKILNSAFW